MFKYILILFFSFIYTDQASWIAKSEAYQAIDLIEIGKIVYEYCEPCGDAEFKKYMVKDVEVKKVDNERYYYLDITTQSGASITSDLAYIYVSDPKSDNYINLAMLCNIPVQQVSEYLPNLDSLEINLIAAQNISQDFIFSQAWTSIYLLGAIDEINTTGKKDYSEQNKLVIENKKEMLTYLAESLENNSKTAWPADGNEKNINNVQTIYDYLFIAYDSYSSYLEYNLIDMKNKADVYIQKAIDLLNSDK